METAPTSAPARHKSKMRERTEYWALRIFLVMLPALGTYLEARMEIKARARAEAAQVKSSAEAGYAELVRAVDEMQKQLREEHDHLLMMEGHIQVIESYLHAQSALSMVAPPAPHTPVVAQAPSHFTSQTWAAPEAPPATVKLSATLDEAKSAL
jgi:hypothetical protein